MCKLQTKGMSMEIIQAQPTAHSQGPPSAKLPSVPKLVTNVGEARLVSAMAAKRTPTAAKGGAGANKVSA